MRRQLFTTIICLLNAGWSTVAWTQADEPAPPEGMVTLTADQVVQLTLARSHIIQIERLTPQLAEQALRSELGVFDPELRAEYNYRNTEIAAYGNAESEDAAVSLGIGGVLPWGTAYNLGVQTNDRTTPFEITSGGDQIITAGDSVSTFTGLSVSQPVLRGFGLPDAYANVRIARKSRTRSDEVFRATLIDTLTNALQAYYQLYYAEQNFAIAERSQANAAQLLADNERRIELGAMAPLDIYQAESEVALREGIVISAERFRRQAENRLKAFLTDSPESVANVQLRVTQLPDPVERTADPARDYPVALANRPDYRQAQLGLDIRELELAQARRQALPRLDLVASAGRGATDRTLSRSFDRLSDDGSEQYSVGAVFSYPIFNRSRDAARTVGYLRRNQAQLMQSQLEQHIMLELDDAAARLDTGWRRLLSTRRARVLAEQSLEAEEKKLQVGNTSTFFVLRLQADLGTAEIRETEALVDYLSALAEYDRVRGLTLDTLRVQID